MKQSIPRKLQTEGQRPSKPRVAGSSPAGCALDADAEKAHRLKKFRAKVEPGHPKRCWPFRGFIDPQGYGRITILGRSYLAHRLAYELANDVGPTKQELVLHSCDNRPCCNPKHLRIGTHWDNQQDKVDRNRQAKGAHNGRAKLTRADVIEVLRLLAAGAKITHLADRYGVTRKAIRLIKQGKNWRHLTAPGTQWTFAEVANG